MLSKKNWTNKDVAKIYPEKDNISEKIQKWKEKRRVEGVSPKFVLNRYNLSVLLVVFGILFLIIGIVFALIYKLNRFSSPDVVFTSVLISASGLGISLVGTNTIINLRRLGMYVLFACVAGLVLSTLLFILNYPKNWYYPTISYITVVYASSIALLILNAFVNVVFNIIQDQQILINRVPIKPKTKKKLWFRRGKQDYTTLYNKIREIDYSKYFEFHNSQVVEKYWLDKPFSMAIICKDKEITYNLVEPKITQEEYYILEKIHREIRDKIILKEAKELENKEELLFKELVSLLRKHNYDLSVESIGKLWYYLSRNFIGYEKINSLLKDPYIEDVSCNGYNLPVYVFHKAHGSIPTNIIYEAEELDHFVLKLSQKANSQVSLEKPLVDATLPSGARIQITYRNVVSTKGSSFTIRKFSEEPITPVDLISWNTINAEIMAFVWLAVENRKNMLIVGGTASGKTTMMNAISFFIPYNSKIVSLEDTREVQLPHKNWLPLMTKESEKGRVDLFDLLKAALRQRPEYILVGEIRGKEAITLFQAMNTGHTTYSTLHAGDIESAINRLIYDPINVPTAMFESLDLVMTLSLEYMGGNVARRMTALHEISLDKKGRITHSPIVEWIRSDDNFTKIGEFGKSRVVEDIGKIYGMNYDETIGEIQKRAVFLKNLTEHRPYTMSELMDKLNEYRRDFYGRG
ncbi:hypothetical protein DRP05_04255 [Archaeoglobales archaeon]|nr:MAG: hypothetical protein DRP05_04255 [Archaeoglobales archaeon]